MRYLNDIVCEINDELRRVMPSNSKFAPIATQMMRKGNNGKIFPSYVDNYGEGKYVGPEDDYDAIVYHRVNSLVPGRILSTWGDGKSLEAIAAKMQLVAFGRRDKIKMSGDEMALKILASIPPKVSSPLISKLNFRSVEVKTADSNINSLQVFQEEFPDSGFFLKPEQFLIRINYTIESVFLKGCFKTC